MSPKYKNKTPGSEKDSAANIMLQHVSSDTHRSSSYLFCDKSIASQIDRF
jgi:hypothetical protein